MFAIRRYATPASPLHEAQMMICYISRDEYDSYCHATLIFTLRDFRHYGASHEHVVTCRRHAASRFDDDARLIDATAAGAARYYACFASPALI